MKILHDRAQEEPKGVDKTPKILEDLKSDPKSFE